jgi:hypothetical protein
MLQSTIYGGTSLIKHKKEENRSKMAIDEPLTVVQMAINGLKVRKW